MASSTVPEAGDLPDLSEVPVHEEKQQMDEAELIETTMKALHPEEDIDFDELASRAKVYEEKLDEGHKAKGKETEKKPPSVSPPVVAPAPAVQAEQEPPKGKQKQKGKASRAAKLALAGAGSAPDVKVAVPEKQPSVVIPKQKTVTPERTPEPVGATWDDVETKTPKLGDQGFPVVPVPDPSKEYSTLSVISSQYEDVSGDVTSLSSKVDRLTKLVGDLNIRMAKYEKDIQGVKEDKSAFYAQQMERLRVIERAVGNRPSLGTRAEETVVAPQTPAPVSSAPAVPAADLDNVDVSALLARLGM